MVKLMKDSLVQFLQYFYIFNIMMIIIWLACIGFTSYLIDQHINNCPDFSELVIPYLLGFIFNVILNAICHKTISNPKLISYVLIAAAVTLLTNIIFLVMFIVQKDYVFNFCYIKEEQQWFFGVGSGMQILINLGIGFSMKQIVNTIKYRNFSQNKLTFKEVMKA